MYYLDLLIKIENFLKDFYSLYFYFLLILFFSFFILFRIIRFFYVLLLPYISYFIKIYNLYILSNYKQFFKPALFFYTKPFKDFYLNSFLIKFYKKQYKFLSSIFLTLIFFLKCLYIFFLKKILQVFKYLNQRFYILGNISKTVVYNLSILLFIIILLYPVEGITLNLILSLNIINLNFLLTNINSIYMDINLETYIIYLCFYIFVFIYINIYNNYIECFKFFLIFFFIIILLTPVIGMYLNLFFIDLVFILIFLNILIPTISFNFFYKFDKLIFSNLLNFFKKNFNLF